ncbi:hypothetical protein ACFY12_17245 [Streptomyces sp. NPDC001339]
MPLMFHATAQGSIQKRQAILFLMCIGRTARTAPPCSWQGGAVLS